MSSYIREQLLYAFECMTRSIPTQDRCMLCGWTRIDGAKDGDCGRTISSESECEKYKVPLSLVGKHLWFSELLHSIASPSAIQIWRFDEAPKEYQDLSEHGGDEDWVALLPASFDGEIITWLEDGSSFGCCSVSEHKLSDGRIVRIGAHA